MTTVRRHRAVSTSSLLKMLMSTRNSVMSIAMRPGTTSGGMRNEAHDVTTNRPELRKLREREPSVKWPPQSYTSAGLIQLQKMAQKIALKMALLKRAHFLIIKIDV